MPDFKDVASTLKPKERVWSLSLSRLCLDFCTGLSYRRSADLVNAALHRHEEDSMKARTLADYAERVGGEIQRHLEATSEAILKEHHFEPGALRAADGPPAPDVPPTHEHADVQRAWEEDVAQKAEEINAQREPREQIKDMWRFPQMESPQDKCCYISIDDIGVKHQKETRADGGFKSAKYVQNTVVHIQGGGGSYCLTASSMDKAFRMLVAFLLSNNLLSGCTLVFFADGAKNIKSYIESYFAGFPYSLVLDWYHLRKKSKELISSSIKGTIDQKKGYAQSLLRMLWVGNVNEAVSYLKGFDGSLIKSDYWLGELVGYLERKEPQIVCYALRHGLGLRISSNRVEKTNDLLVAQRQKHSGMSWSFDGSGSLASISMVAQNGEMDQWLRSRSLLFSMAEETAAA
jgi:hypothetical protein